MVRAPGLIRSTGRDARASIAASSRRTFRRVPYARSAANARSRRSSPDRPRSAGTTRFEYAPSSTTLRMASSATERAVDVPTDRVIRDARPGGTAHLGPTRWRPSACGRPGRLPADGPDALPVRPRPHGHPCRGWCPGARVHADRDPLVGLDHVRAEHLEAVPAERRGGGGVRAEGPDPADDRLRRIGPADPAVLRLGARRRGRLVGVLRMLRQVAGREPPQDPDQVVGADRREPGAEGPRVVVRMDRLLPARQHRPRVEALVHPHHRDAGRSCRLPAGRAGPAPPPASGAASEKWRLTAPHRGMARAAGVRISPYATTTSTSAAAPRSASSPCLRAHRRFPRAGTRAPGKRGPPASA